MTDDRGWGPSGQDPSLPPPPSPGTEPAGWDTGPAGGWGTGGWQGQPPTPQTNGPAIAALICGIIALLLSWIPLVNLLALVLGVAAVVTGILGLRRAGTPGYGQRGLAIGGLVTGGLSLLVSLAILAFLGALFANPDVRAEIEEEIQRQMELQEQQQEREGGFDSS